MDQAARGAYFAQITWGHQLGAFLFDNALLYLCVEERIDLNVED